jgi:hypothetical protein
MDMDGIGRVAAQNADLEHSLSLGARAASYGSVDDLDVGVHLRVKIDEYLRCRSFITCPPPLNLQLAGRTFYVGRLGFLNRWSL